jgi:hypothetical protein
MEVRALGFFCPAHSRKVLKKSLFPSEVQRLGVAQMAERTGNASAILHSEVWVRFRAQWCAGEQLMDIIPALPDTLLSQYCYHAARVVQWI